MFLHNFWDEITFRETNMDFPREAVASTEVKGRNFTYRNGAVVLVLRLARSPIGPSTSPGLGFSLSRLRVRFDHYRMLLDLRGDTYSDGMIGEDRGHVRHGDKTATER